MVTAMNNHPRGGPPGRLQKAYRGTRHFAPAPADFPNIYRLRLKFSRGNELKYISHLDLIRLWEKALRRARLPVAYSEGFSPHPRLSIAAPLALGITSDAELMDIFLERRLAPDLVSKAVPLQLPAGVVLTEVQTMSPGAPSLQSQVRFAEYRLQLATDRDPGSIEESLDGFLSRDSFPWQHARDTGLRQYDLRPLVEDIWIVASGAGECVLGLRLRLDSGGAGRPEQVAAALGFSSRPLSIHRTRLILASSDQPRSGSPLSPDLPRQGRGF